MKCPECSADTREWLRPEVAEDGYMVKRTRRCVADHSHIFETFEVLPTVWTSAKHRHEAAVEAIERRLKLHRRNEAIRADAAAGVRGKALARKWNLTPQAISLICQDKGR